MSVAAAFAATASISATAMVEASQVLGPTLPDTGTIEAIEAIVTSVVPSVVASILPSAATTTVPVESVSLFLPASFEVAAIFAGALSGALTAVNRRYDIIGVFVIALVNGLGGGIIRDVLLQDYGIFALESPRALYAVVAAALLAMFFAALSERLRPALLTVDAFSLALFALVGADRALVAGLDPLPAILLGAITASGGGVLRDLLLHQEPALLRRGSLYASAAVTGSIVYVMSVTWLNITKPVAMVVAAGIAVVLRFGSLWLGWESPEPVDLSTRVTALPRHLWRSVRLRGRDPEDRTPGRPE